MTNLADEYRAMSKAFKEIQQRERSLADAIVLPPPTLSRSSFFSAQTALQEHLDRRRSALAEAGALVAPFRGIADSMTTIMKGFELTGIADIADNMRSLRLGFGSLKFKGDIASFCRIADLSQALVARIPISSVNEFWQVSPMKASRLIGSFEQLATKAEAFYSAWNDTKAWSIPAPARAAPVIECFNAADLLVPPTGGEELAEPMAEARHEIQKGIDDSLLGFLQQD